jgi:hypothetical protein
MTMILVVDDVPLARIPGEVKRKRRGTNSFCSRVADFKSINYKRLH